MAALLVAIVQFAGTHILGIVISIVATFGIGFLWHGPIFGMQWIALNKLTPPKQGEANLSMMMPGLIANLILAIVQAAVLGTVFDLAGLTSIVDALMIATIIWLPFTALVLTNIYAWSGKPMKLLVLDATHALIALWAVAAVMYATL